MTFKAFTLKSKGKRLCNLITDCEVSEAFDLLKKGEHPKIETFKALWDTGASESVISKKVVDQLNLNPVGKTEVFHAGGASTVNMYFINLILPNDIVFPFLKVTEGVLTSFDILIGMDIITVGDFAVTNVGENTTFSFRIPSIEEIDFIPKTRV